MAASRSEALAPRRASYQDVLDAPAHQIAEIVAGRLYTHLTRPALPPMGARVARSHRRPTCAHEAPSPAQPPPLP